MLTKLEKRIIASIQDDIAITERPYLEIAKNLGISQEALLKKLKDLCNRGIIRRFGATIRHQKSGFEANAMAAWEVDEDRIDKVGKILASFSQVSHCYRRNPTDNWSYNLYTMIHSKDEKSCWEIVRKMSDKASVETYILLFSRKELKKTSMKYFPNDNNPHFS
jgi:DNA-binding Lrp family transcriptional regulator